MPKTPAAPSGARANIEIAAIGLGALMAALAQTLVIPVLPSIGRDTGASTSASQWLLTATLLVAAVSVPIITRLADIVGRRLMLLVSLSGLALGSLVCALTSNIAVMIAGRAIAGVSSAAIPLGISLLAVTLPDHRKGSATALISAMLGVGSSLGLPMAGLIAEHFDYHVLYWIGAVGAVVAVAFIALFAPETEPAGGSFDLPGAVLLGGALLCLVLPLSQGSDWGWASVPTLCLFAAAVLLLVAFLQVERRTASPMVDLGALRNPPVAITNVCSVLIGFALFASFTGTASYVQAPEATGYGFGSSVLTAGLCLFPSGLLMLLLSPLTARLIQAWGGGRVLALAGLIIAGGLVERIILTDSLWQVIVGASIVGAGTGIGYAALPSLINTHTPAAELAAANGINNLARSLGSTLASAVGGSLLTAITMTLGAAQLPSLTGYRVLFSICAVAALIAAAGGLLVSSAKVRSAAAAHEAKAVPVPVS